MSILLFLIPITIFLGLAGLAAFLWCVKTKQYEDLEGSANRILFDETLTTKDQKNSQKSNIALQQKK